MFDTLSKFLADEYSQDISSWLVGKPIKLTELKPKELSLEPIRADSVVLLKSRKLILHAEFQTDPDDQIGFRMADYSLRIYRKFPNRRLVQVVVYLRETNSQQVYKTDFQVNRLRNEFDVIRLWEQPTEQFLQRPGLLPYAALTRTIDRAATLREVAQRIEALENRQEKSNLAAASGVLAALSLDKEVIKRILRRDIMQQSPLYQEWQQEAEQRGRQEGQLEERRSLALKMLQENLPLEMIARMTELSIEQLQQLRQT
ncbi:Rpn family recombination-promoting nuclease/putative transposase [Leptolyngbya sp. AN03gr2]|uniref:Rpn family recombination-promoting nuclease/putative transposase n=1 Tax=unclassified Leptolyngbya TaxID=2650499 RepID=UPI003D311B07